MGILLGNRENLISLKKYIVVIFFIMAINSCYREFFVKSLKDFLETISLIRKKTYGNELWFRGEDRDYRDYALTPSLFREHFFRKLACESKEVKFKKSKSLKIQLSLNCFEKLRSFLNTISSYMWYYVKDYNYHEDNIDYIALLRHYGIANEMLDFSRSPFIALFFALQGNLNSNEDAVVYVLNPYLLNLQISLGKYMGYILTARDFNLLVRHFLKTRVFKSIWINPETYPFLEVLKPQILKKDLEIFLKKIGFSYKEKRKIFYNIFGKRNLINISIYTTPVAVSFKYNHHYMKAQEAVGILFGFSWLQRNNWKIENIGFTNLCDYIKFLYKKNNKLFIKLINKANPTILWKLRIPGERKQEIFKDLILYTGLNRFKIFGNDLRFIESYAIFELLHHTNDDDLKKLLYEI